METERILWEQISFYRELMKDEKIVGKSANFESVIKCLQLFENITKFLGIYKEIMTEVRVHLSEAIFSRQLTASEMMTKEKSPKLQAYVERVPYFCLYEHERIKNRNEVERYSENILELEKSLQNERSTVNKLQKLTEEKLSDIQQLKQEVENSSQQLEDSKKTNKLDHNSRNLEKYELDRKLTQISNEKTNFEKSLQNSHQEVERLVEYEKGYYNLSKKFAGTLVMKENDEEHENTEEFPWEIETDTLLLMSNDILILENVLINDYEKQREELKHGILEQGHDCRQSEPRFVTAEADEMRRDERVAELSTRFSRTKAGFVPSFNQLQLEKRELDYRRMEAIKQKSQIPDPRYLKELLEIQEMYSYNEASLNLYSAVLLYSTNDGRTFYDSPDLKYCGPCAEKTVICPHNIHEESRIFVLPRGCSHIKVQRPSINPDPVNLESEPNFESSLRSEVKRNKKFRNSVESVDVDEFLPFEILLEEFGVRKYPRVLTQDFLLSVFEDFWGAILLRDNQDVENDGVRTMQEKLEAFFNGRCKFPRATQLVLYDYLENLINCAGENQMLLLFCHVLLGNIDASVLRYLLLLSECIDHAVVDSEEDFRFMLETIYPFLEEDEVENLVLSFISFSENHFSRINAVDFFTNNLLKLKDPRLILLLSEASELSTQLDRALSFKEYQVFLEIHTSLADKKLSGRLYKELSRVYRHHPQIKAVPLTKAIQVVTFLGFLEVFEQTKNLLSEHKICRPISTDQTKVRWTYTGLKDIAELLRNL